jgi:hypothetical protein
MNMTVLINDAIIIIIKHSLSSNVFTSLNTNEHRLWTTSLAHKKPTIQRQRRRKNETQRLR